MKSVCLLCIVCLIIVACNKASAPAPAGTLPPVTPPHDSTVVKDTVVAVPPPTTSDSTTLLESKWNGHQDSIVNINYDDVDGGYPIPGVLNNPPGDYWNFLPDGGIDAVIEHNHYTDTYTYSGSNQIIIQGLPADRTKPCMITTLNATTLIFHCSDTSSIGGIYYRQVWLTK
jgi:hypothetical protein